MVFENGKWDFDKEEGREEILQWREKRIRKTADRSSKFLFYLRTFNFDTLHSFAQNISLIVVLQMLLACISVYIFQVFEISFDIHLCLFVSPIVFPLAFCIDTDFQRRERVLEDLAVFRSSAMVWYFCMRDWKDAAHLSGGWLRAVRSKVQSILFHLREYLLTSKVAHRKVILCAIYEDFSDVNQLIERLRASRLPHNAAIVSRAIHLLNSMCLSFERLRVVREYRSPRSIRSFNKVFIMFLPIILAPYFVGIGIKSGSKWQPYCIAVIIAFVFSVLQGCQDKLDDPFNGMSEDDIKMDTFDELNHSLEQTMRRTFAIGRFKVSVEEIIQPRPSARPSVSSILENSNNNTNNANNCSSNNINSKTERGIKRRLSQTKWSSFSRLRAHSTCDAESRESMTPRFFQNRKNMNMQKHGLSTSRESSISYGAYNLTEIPESANTSYLKPGDAYNTSQDFQINGEARSEGRQNSVSPDSSKRNDEPKERNTVRVCQRNAPASLHGCATKSPCVSHHVARQCAIDSGDHTQCHAEVPASPGEASEGQDTSESIAVEEEVQCQPWSNTAESAVDTKTDDWPPPLNSSPRLPLLRKTNSTPPLPRNCSMSQSSYYHLDSGGDSCHSEDDNDIRSILWEWKKLDSALRREIYAKRGDTK